MKTYKVYCPSYKRSHLAISHRLFDQDKFCYVVREEEKDFYAVSFPEIDIMFIPESAGVRDISTTRNWILENKKTDVVVMVDDDMQKFFWCYQRKYVEISHERLHAQIENMIQMCEDADIGIFGVNTLDDPMAYSINKPYSFSQVILGPFCGLVDTSLRYDERLPLKEDYDMSLQQIKKHRRALRANFLMYRVDHGKMEGGCQTYRSRDLEKAQNELLKKKWGKVVYENKLHPNSINMIVKTGL